MNPAQQKVWWPIAAAITLANIVLRLSTVSLEVFLHYGFGERFFRLIDLVLGILALYMAGYFAQVVSPGSFKPLVYFGVAVLVAGLAQLIFIQIRKSRGVVIHSRYWGNSWPIFYWMGLSHQRIQHYVEPLFAFLVSVVVSLYTPYVLVGYWIGIGAVCWVFLCQIEMWKWNNKILDAIDHEIEAKYFEEAVVDRKSPKETQGFFVPVSPNFTKAQRSTLKDAFERLDPKLQELMGESQGEIAKKEAEE